jgi:biotin transport system substrate-specific component
MKIREMLLAGTFVTMMIISAYIIVPIGPVPITMQPLVVLLAGMLLGSRLSAVSICVWVMLGCVGLPVFNQGQGGAVMLVGLPEALSLHLLLRPGLLVILQNVTWKQVI